MEKAIRSNDFTNVKVGDKVITDEQFYPYPKICTRTVEKVTKTTFQLEGYEGRPGSGRIYKKDGGVPYPKDRMTSDAIVWTPEIQAEYDAFVAERDDRRKLKSEIEKLLGSLASIVKYEEDNANLNAIDNILNQAATDIKDLVKTE